MRPSRTTTAASRRGGPPLPSRSWPLEISVAPVAVFMARLARYGASTLPHLDHPHPIFDGRVEKAYSGPHVRSGTRANALLDQVYRCVGANRCLCSCAHFRVPRGRDLPVERADPGQRIMLGVFLMRYTSFVLAAV